jgi:hypothetical protein
MAQRSFDKQSRVQTTRLLLLAATTRFLKGKVNDQKALEANEEDPIANTGCTLES